MNIFAGNLSFDATQGDVKKLFEGFGNVASVVIVMEKEKKAPKSRGFGFVQMPDEQQALAALAALNGKEFMGRVLNVNPARPKGQKVTVEAEQYPREETEQKKAWFGPVFNKHITLGPSFKGIGRPILSGLKDGRMRPSGQPGTYKGGRRSRSYVKRHGLTGMQEEAKPRRKNQDNPMRWRKKKYQPKPWRKPEGSFKPWKKTGGEIRTWRKPGEESKPWKKPTGEAKPWSKSSERPQKSRFNPSTSFASVPSATIEGASARGGMVRGNGERSRTKGRKNRAAIKD